MTRICLLFGFALLSAIGFSCSNGTVHPIGKSGGPIQGGENIAASAKTGLPKIERERKIEDLKLTGDLTLDYVTNVWGQPDGKRGSGIEYFAYELSDGDELWLSFLPNPPRRLNGALVFSPHTGQHKPLF
jgi:hypothetical protein